MRVERDKQGNVTIVVLSRRNLLSLLAKLDGFPKNSRCTIVAPHSVGHDKYNRVAVKAEENDPHYAYETRGTAKNRPGDMREETELYIKDHMGPKP